MTTPIQIAHHNPIPEALTHYEHEFIETLAGVAVTSSPAPWSSAVEGRDGGAARTARLAVRAGRNTLRANLSETTTVHLWPTWGLLDARLLRYGRSRQAIVLHDPIPIRPQVGHSALAERWAGRAGPRSPLVLVHSSTASRDARRRLPLHQVVEVNHPILNRQRPQQKSDRATLVVAGQFKPERDLDLMRQVATWTKGAWDLRVYGRGWPPIEGWRVQSRFLSEEQLDRALASAHAVLIPYRHYYQSGIAIRALELGTVSIGPTSSFLADLNAAAPELAPQQFDSASMRRALEIAVQSASANAVYSDYLKRAQVSWANVVEVLAGSMRPRP